MLAYGDFGKEGRAYDEARKRYPNVVIDFILEKLPLLPNILDVGCGTGIATRQFFERNVKVSGADKDEKMIAIAREHGPDAISYTVAPTEDLPFEDNSFDAITAFSAFHWFANNEAVKEIRRVLAPGGFFFAVNKYDTGDFKTGYRAVIEKYIDIPLPKSKDGYEPKKLLEDGEFAEVSEKQFGTSDIFSIPEALKYMQSTGLWGLVSDERKSAALRELTSYFGLIVKDHVVVRPLTLSLLYAHNEKKSPAKEERGALQSRGC